MATMAEVGIYNFYFEPAEVRVPVGGTVVWKAHTPDHTTTSRDQVWGSDIIPVAETFSFAFTKPGTYKYICAIHPEMEGTVIAQ